MIVRRSWAPWFCDRIERRAAAEAEKRAVMAAEDRVKAAVSSALANERQAAWWRLVEASGWKGGKPMVTAVPIKEAQMFRQFWNAMGAKPHTTEGAA